MCNQGPLQINHVGVRACAKEREDRKEKMETFKRRNKSNTCS